MNPNTERELRLQTYKLSQYCNQLPGGKRILMINMRAQHITFNKANKRPVGFKII